MTIFPRNNLPTDSLNWGREVEKSINNLESGFRTAEVNNVSRDAQLQSSLRRLDTTVTQLATTTATADAANAAAIDALEDAAAAQATATTANSTAISANATAIAANSAAIEALEDAAAAQETATSANTTAIEALEEASAAALEASSANTKAIEALEEADSAQADAIAALQGLGSLDEATSTYKIHAANLTVGTLSGDRIRGGVITGTQLTTADPGNQRVVLNSNRITLNNGSVDTGSIYGSNYGSNSATYIDGNACVLNSTQGNYFVGTTGVFGGSFSSEFNITANGNLRTGTGTLEMGASTFSRNAAGQMEGPGFRSTGNMNVAGQFFYDAPTATGTTYPLYINITTNQVYRLSSSARYKTEIQDAEFDYETLLQAKVRTFRNKQDVEQNGVESAELTYGYIAEELHDLGLTDFVVYEADDNGEMRPESVNYMSMALASHEMLKVQDSKIKSLEARLAALEDKVQ